jgi:hypothetical protein
VGEVPNSRRTPAQVRRRREEEGGRGGERRDGGGFFLRDTWNGSFTTFFYKFVTQLTSILHVGEAPTSRRTPAQEAGRGGRKGRGEERGGD